MAEPNVNTPDPVVIEPEPEPTVTPPEPTAEEKKFTQAELDAVITDRLKREKAKQEEAASAAKKKAEADALAENAEWQKLAEQRQAELDAAQTKVKAAELLEQKRQAASKHGIPEALIPRLQGETPEEMEADAEIVAALLKDPKKVPPNLSPTNPSGDSSITGESEADRRRRLGI
jgi:hypothetical protein